MEIRDGTAAENMDVSGDMELSDELGLSENCIEVLKSRYLKRNAEGEPVESPKDLFRRVAREVASAEKGYGLSTIGCEEVEEEFYELMITGTFMPNSPTLMNAGRRMGMLSACFVLPVEDSIDAIFGSIRHAALIQKAGGGTGFSFSRLRPSGDIVKSSGGRTSGPLSFLRVFSKATDAIQQGAFRRGANMGVMRIDHPDIAHFITIKEDPAELTNFNLSVGVTDVFMEQLLADPGTPHIVFNPRNGEKQQLLKADNTPWTVGELFDLIVEKAWKSGEPGVIFLDRMNRDNPTPHVGRIEATNPCGEQPLLPYESCNLGSINLAKLLCKKDNKPALDYQRFRQVIRLSVRFLDNVIDINRYPLEEIDRATKANRKIGLGIMGFADVLFALGIPYNSEEGIKKAEEVMSFLQEESHKVSEELAGKRGVFPNWSDSVWGKQKRPMRNAATTTVAPTGTISIISGCSCGIEPLFSLVFQRNVLNGKKLLEANTHFKHMAEKRSFYSEKLAEDLAHGRSLSGMEQIPDDVKRIFVTAHDISPEWHIRMQAAFQRHCDSSISKTINFPTSASKEEINSLYLQAYREQVKGVTVYRDGCRENQPMALKKEKAKKGEEKSEERQPLTPIKLPEIMSSLRIRQVTPFGNMHIKITVDPEKGLERELFAQLGRGGDIANSDLEAICRLTSLFLRCGGSIHDVVEQLNGIGSSLSVPSREGRIMSLADGLAKGIRKYLILKEKNGLEKLLLGQFDMDPLRETLEEQKKKENNQGVRGFSLKCPNCPHGYLTFEEGCAICHSCGYSRC